MAVAFTSTEIKWLLGGIVLVTGAVVYFTQRFLGRQTTAGLTEKYRDRTWSSPLEGRNKYPEVDVFRFRNTLLEYGLVVALLLMLLAFSWTTRDTSRVDLSEMLAVPSDIELHMPRTAEPPPPPPPPPVNTSMIVATDLPEVKTMVFEDQSVDQHSDVEAPPPVMTDKKASLSPPPPPPANTDEREIFRIVEQQPLFPGCEDVPDKKDRQACADEKLLAFIYRNIRYPEMARENGVEGMVVIQFVVEQDGSISEPNLVRDIGAGCGEEAKRVVMSMPAWNPGKQRDRAVRVMFTLPVRFKLE
ncbi:MAG: hypothetical protein RLY31_552 [Bacteroidota bacterium]|jgi:protein TonB